mgnify:FL=1
MKEREMPRELAVLVVRLDALARMIAYVITALFWIVVAMLAYLVAPLATYSLSQEVREYVVLAYSLAGLSVIGLLVGSHRAIEWALGIWLTLSLIHI